jgi:para-aminobenzoate synthetase/4-amino-4-deoxychorismate lyase
LNTKSFALIESYAPSSEVSSFIFEEPYGQIIAAHPAQVKDALAEVEQAVAGGMHAAGYLAYEAAGGLDAAFKTQDNLSGPVLWFGLFKTRRSIAAGSMLPLQGGYALGQWYPAVSRTEYDDALAAIKEHILDGDTYQVNYTFQQEADFTGDELALYRDLCRAQEGAYSAYLNLGDYQLLSASPELFFTLQDGVLTSRPMKGTKARGRWSAEDQAQAQTLRTCAKERAENVMIVDLLRNDLGKVAKTGSVAVPSLWEVERYPTVWQLTSSVQAAVQEDIGLVAVMEALFPCGSVTGAPKVRTMELIQKIEKTPRGVYTGAVGYVSPGMEMCFNVAIRTVWIDRHRAKAVCGVGGGITHYSDTEMEYRECLLKARFIHERRPPFKLLESLLYEAENGYYLLDRHLERIAASAEYFGFAYEIKAMKDVLIAASKGFEEGNQRVRLLMDAAGKTTVEAAIFTAPKRPFKAILAAQPVDSADVFLYHKTTHRPFYDDQIQRYPAYDEVILYNERDELTECCRGNLVVVLEGERWTPPLDCGLLPGVCRAEELARGRIQERVLYKQDLIMAEALYMINSLRRWVPLHWVQETA